MFFIFNYNAAILITDFNDNYQYCNIVCINKNSNFYTCLLFIYCLNKCVIYTEISKFNFI